jgi:predicted metal-dependent enzyme (double-stranded beta helix superfamily)
VPGAALSAFPGLDELVRLADRAVRRGAPQAVVAALCDGLPALIERHRRRIGGDWLRADPLARRRIELHRSPDAGYQILAMIWAPGQDTPIHDHDGAWGVESTWHGELRATGFLATGRRGDLFRLQAQETARLGVGAAAGLEPEQGLHLCRNPSPSRVALTVHVYARPLEAFHVYAAAGEGWYRREPCLPALER